MHKYDPPDLVQTLPSCAASAASTAMTSEQTASPPLGLQTPGKVPPVSNDKGLFSDAGLHGGQDEILPDASSPVSVWSDASGGRNLDTTFGDADTTVVAASADHCAVGQSVLLTGASGWGDEDSSDDDDDLL